MSVVLIIQPHLKHIAGLRVHRCLKRYWLLTIYTQCQLVTKSPPES